jgi:hypothetical protein
MAFIGALFTAEIAAVVYTIIHVSMDRRAR